ncbi:MAG: transposase [Gammaproteobacteria bacterium]|nr:transposase [Gammaproteobacteria bacterium]
MNQFNPQELHVSIDVGCYQHDISVGLADGRFLGRFEINHDNAGFADLFDKIEEYKTQSNGSVSVAMEGYNGHARPLDRLIQAKEYRLLNINNLKLARFKEIFPGAAKTDSIDSRKGLELFQLQQTLPLAKNVLQEVHAIPQVNQELKRLTRRRRRLVNERVSYINTLQSDLRALCPGLVEITNDVKNVWFLNFLASANDLKQLARKSKKTLLNISQVGQKYVEVILKWQKTAMFSDDISFMSPMIKQDVTRIIELRKMIKALDNEILKKLEHSEIGQRLLSINGFGVTCCAELAGEIGCIERFRKESSLALTPLYADMVTKLKTITSMIYNGRMTISGNHTMDIKVYYQHPDKLRVETLPAGHASEAASINILDLANGKGQISFPAQNMTVPYPFEPGSTDNLKQEEDPLGWYHTLINADPSKVTEIETKEIKGSLAQGFLIEDQGTQIRVWVNSNTQLPVSLNVRLPQQDGQELFELQAELTFNKKIDAELFKLDN